MKKISLLLFFILMNIQGPAVGETQCFTNSDCGRKEECCNGTCCPGKCCNGKCCDGSYCTADGKACCPREKVCPDGCCPDGQGCCDGRCCYYNVTCAGNKCCELN